MTDGADELRQIAAQLELKGHMAPAVAAGIVAKGALNVKDAMRRDAEGIRHAPHFPATISFDVTQTLRGPEAEIGPEDTGQGELAGILYFGTSKNGPVRDLGVGLREEEPRFLKALEDAADPDL